jgi:DNA-binding protein H-NS
MGLSKAISYLSPRPLSTVDMTKTYTQLATEIEALKAKANAVRIKEVAGVVGRIKEAIALYGLTANDLGFAEAMEGKKATGEKSTPSKGKVASAPTARSAKFRDGEGNTWSGRGPRPQWLRDALAAGHALGKFAIGIEGPRAKTGAKKSKAQPAAKYRDDAGNAWSGRGRQPGWLKAAVAAGKTLEEFAS